MKKCMVCGSVKLVKHQAKLAEYVAERIFDRIDNLPPVNLFHCQDCGFAFYDYRYSDEEIAKLYKNYRDAEYCKQRHKYDRLYTSKVNEAVGNHPHQLINRRLLSNNILKKYFNTGTNKLTVLDYGGDSGQYIPPIFDNATRYVYEVSGVDGNNGIHMINDYLDIAQYGQFDCILCNHVIEHFADMDNGVKYIHKLGSKDTIYYIELPFDSPFYVGALDYFQFLFNPLYKNIDLIKSFLERRKDNVLKLSEHINFFTPNSAEKMLARNGFSVLETQVNNLDLGYRKMRVISIICRIKN